MSEYVTKNYSTDGGDTLVIGGKLVIEEDAEVTGLEGGGSYTLPAATSDTLGGVKVGTGLTINEGVLSADGYTLPTASADTLGGVKVGSGLTITNGVLSADGITPAANQAASDATELSDLVTAFNALLSALKTAGLMVDDE